MEVRGRGVVQQALQRNLPGSVVQKISTSHHMCDLLPGVIDHDCQLVGIQRPASSDDKITDRTTDVFTRHAADKVGKLDSFLINPHS